MIDDTVLWLQQMHQIQQEPDFVLPDNDRFEEDFEREFGPGDEQYETTQRTDQEQFDHGHKESDF